MAAIRRPRQDRREGSSADARTTPMRVQISSNLGNLRHLAPLP